ncbi:MAG TPA: esterase-like activity of phytase family protein [Rubricoccaceae bacterium]|jgi:hypothetical protein
MRLAVLTITAALTGCSPRIAVPTEPAAPLPAPGRYTFDDSRVLGTVDGVEVHEGGLSGLDRLADGRFIAVTDRGPNVDAATSEGRPAKRFPVPNYQPSLVLLRFEGDEIIVTERRPIVAPDGGPVSGRPPSAVASDGAIVGDDLIVETALGPDGARLAPDPWGLDAEGVADAGDGTVWICEEYRPSLWRIDLATGRVLSRVVPQLETETDYPLPLVFRNRTANLGFEGVEVVQTPQGQRVVAALQGPLLVPDGAEGTPITRLVMFDPASGAAETRAFALDGPRRRIGDVAGLPDGRVLIVEQGPTTEGGPWGAAIYALDLASGRGVDTGRPPETFASADAARAAGVPLLTKTLVVDLVAAGWPTDARKPEGLVVSGQRVIVMADNDYGIEAPANDGRAAASGRRTIGLVFDLPAAP